MGGGASKNQVAPSDAASTTKLNETLQQLAAERDSHSSLQVRTHGSWLLPSHVERRGEAHVRQTDQPTFLSPLCHRGNSAAVASGFLSSCAGGWPQGCRLGTGRDSQDRRLCLPIHCVPQEDAGENRSPNTLFGAPTLSCLHPNAGAGAVGLCLIVALQASLLSLHTLPRPLSRNHLGGRLAAGGGGGAA
jgi:hypothetical protein